MVKYFKTKKKKPKKKKTKKKIEKKNPPKPKKSKKFLYLFLIFIIIIIFVFSNISYGLSTYNSEASGKTIEVPKFVKLKEECCSYKATFSTIRSIKSLKKDLDNMINSYETLDCDGITYYYNYLENYTITDYGIIDGLLFNQIYITYGTGNSCDIDTTFKKLELLADNFSIEDAIKDGNYVMSNDNIYNYNSYLEFQNNIANNEEDTLRIVSLTDLGDVIIVDLTYSEGKYKVTYDGTRDRLSTDKRSITATKYDNIGIVNNKLYAYNGSTLNTNSAYYLLTLPNE